MESEKYHVLWPDSRITLEEIPREQMLDRMHEILDCDCIEHVSSWIPGVHLIIDESGKIKTPPKPHNEYASALYLGWLIGHDDIVGPAILCGTMLVGPYNEPDYCPLPDQKVADLISFFSEYVQWEV